MVWTHSCSLDKLFIDQQFSVGVILLHRDIWQCRDIHGCHNRRWMGAQASSIWRPMLLLNSLQCTGQWLTMKNYLDSNSTSAQAEKPWHRFYAICRGPLLISPPECFFLCKFSSHLQAPLIAYEFLWFSFPKSLFF